jgi:hypothetical protein
VFTRDEVAATAAELRAAQSAWEDLGPSGRAAVLARAEPIARGLETGGVTVNNGGTA